LVQAESTLIGAAATLELINAELVRPNLLYNSSKGVAQRELEQATSDQKTAEGALKAARDAVRVFGKTALSALRVDVIAWWIAAITIAYRTYRFFGTAAICDRKFNHFAIEIQ
jgi:membrane fusion protein, heavy metal efflux system